MEPIAKHIVVNKTRIERRLEELAKYGVNQNGGIDRSFGTAADCKAREQLITWLKKDLEADINIDPAANIWAFSPTASTLPPLVVGSHHDTVPNGGKFDGALGIILAMEVLSVVKERELSLRHPLAFVSFTAEEPNPFNLSTFGSRMATGKLKPDSLTGVKDAIQQIPLSEALARVGGDMAKLGEARVKPGSLAAFIECHIEQGKRLEKKDYPLAVVSAITGIYRENITICGEANHAGTTVMQDRHDALLAASEFCLAFEQVLKDTKRDDVVGTIGHMEIFPNAVNIIPGKIQLTMEIRTPEDAVTKDLVAKLDHIVAAIENSRGIKFERSLLLDQAGVALDDTVMQCMSAAVEGMSKNYLTLSSMAGHDATHLASITKSGMLFVRSIDGKSHCPEEYSTIEDIEQAGNALLHTILLLDKELD